MVHSGSHCARRLKLTPFPQLRQRPFSTVDCLITTTATEMSLTTWLWGTSQLDDAVGQYSSFVATTSR